MTAQNAIAFQHLGTAFARGIDRKQNTDTGINGFNYDKVQDKWTTKNFPSS